MSENSFLITGLFTSKNWKQERPVLLTSDYKSATQLTSVFSSPARCVRIFNWARYPTTLRNTGGSTRAPSCVPEMPGGDLESSSTNRAGSPSLYCTFWAEGRQNVRHNNKSVLQGVATAILADKKWIWIFEQFLFCYFITYCFLSTTIYEIIWYDSLNMYFFSFFSWLLCSLQTLISFYHVIFPFRWYLC